MRTIGVLLLVVASKFTLCQQPLTNETTVPNQDSSAIPASTTASVERDRVALADHLPPDSLFDAARARFNPVSVNVEVKAQESWPDAAGSPPIRIRAEEIITAAGSYGDFMRFLQVLPGVVATSDTSNEVLIRGGHPIENLYVVDGFEIPNINHLARMGGTGGFAPMIDSALVQNLTLYTGGYGPRFSNRLSSVTEINLLDSKDPRSHAEGDLGIQGVGGLFQTKAPQGDVLLSGHHGLLDAVTKDAGMSGVPTYTNELSRLQFTRPSGDSFTLLNVAGWDSIAITPCQSDWEETSEINSQYAGWRTTTGLRWQKMLSNRSFGILSATDSEQVQHIHQQDQFLDPSKARLGHRACPLSKNYAVTTPVYIEDTHSGTTSASFQYEWASPRLSISAGTAGFLQRPHFDIAQPAGVFSPFSAAEGRTDALGIATDLNTGETGSFVDLSYRGLKNLELNFGSRLQTFALGGHTTFTSRASARYRLGEHTAMNWAFATYAQMPPYIYLLSFPQNRALRPMRAHHRIIGLDLDALPGSHIHIEAYDKPYFDIPAATEFPAVTLHSIPDQLGDQIEWLPMNSSGSGHASGIELSDTTRIGSKALIRGSLAYARAKFAGEDAVYRPSDFDLPFLFNLLSTAQIGRGFGASARFGYATGKPYTPYDMAASLAQNRPIYDLSRVNADRASSYARLDVQINKDIQFRAQHLQLYAGVDNVLNRQNFLTFAWMPLARYHPTNVDPVREVFQMPIFPNFGVRFVIR